MSTPRYAPDELSDALGLHQPTAEQAAVIAAPPGPLVVIAGAGAGKTETMAARVVWLVANGYAEPAQVLGLTFTRKAAGQLLRRVRSRLARLAGAGLLPAEPATGVSGAPTVSTYHAFAGTLLRDHGLLAGIEPGTRLLGAAGLWQLALDVVNAHPGPLDTDKDPAAITSMLLALNGQLAEHLVDTAELRDTHGELERLILTLPPGPRQRAEPNQTLLKLLAAQTQRAELVPLIDTLHARMRTERVMDFGAQMGAAARLAVDHPAVGAALRGTFRVVLLDEYQDTGHAQRMALSALFGGGADDGLALTAVGDPIQSIYGWRGASATNLPRFATDFPLADGSPAPTLELRTSWRNPPEVLTLANEVSAEARRRSVSVHTLRARPAAPPGRVAVALLDDVDAERDWIAEQLQRCYRQAAAAGAEPPTAAVLVRRNADAGPLAAAIAARGLNVEVTGTAGLLSVPEVADLVAMLRLVAEPTAGAAAIRVLTGARWRLGATDLAALWRRATQVGAVRPESATTEPTAAQIAAQADPDADTVCLADALADPGPPERYSEAGYARIAALGQELTALRAHLHHPLPELLAEVRRVLGLDTELRAAAAARGGGAVGTEHLDAFADAVAGYAERTDSAARNDAGAVTGLLAYLEVAAAVEHGLAPAAPAVAGQRVQILTVHAAKGLEWQVVAVPHLVERVFPSTASRRSWLSDAAELPPLLRGDRAGLGEHGVPVLDTDAVNDRKQLSDTIAEHQRRLEQRRVDEERRLLYVAITRAEDTLLVSGHHWGAGDSKPRGPSAFLTEIKDVIDGASADGAADAPGGYPPCGVIDRWAEEPPVGASNPLVTGPVQADWPTDPLGGRRGAVERGAALVAGALAAGDLPGPGESADAPVDAPIEATGWAAEVDALLAERARAAEPPVPRPPGQVSVTGLVELSRDPAGGRQRLGRRLPARPDPHALLGTAFHDWVQRLYHAERLFDLDDLPGAADTDGAGVDAAELALLQNAFRASGWADRTPVAVEVPFELAVGETIVRGRIDAVFAEPDGTVTVVDWKTGAQPADRAAGEQAAVQLAVYRQAWAALTGGDPATVRAVFHYVRAGLTVAPAALPELHELAALLGC